MKNHPADFCYWIFSSHYRNQSIVESIDIEETNLLPAMFLVEISNEISTWTEWSEWSSQKPRERSIQNKGSYF